MISSSGSNWRSFSAIQLNAECQTSCGNMSGQDELFDDIEVDFGGVDFLIELWWELGRFHQLLVSRARHFDEGQTQNWWLLWLLAVFGEEKSKI